MVAIPRPQAPLVDQAGQPAREWYTYFLDLANSAGMTPAQQAAFLKLAQQVAELEAATGTFVIQGIGSVQVFGLPSDGMVQVSLDGDTDSPGATWFYGTGPDGAKGWYAVGDAVEVVTGELTKDVDPTTGVVTLGLADVPDTGTGVLQLTSFDAKGRKTGTAAATTDDLPEGTANLYYRNKITAPVGETIFGQRAVRSENGQVYRPDLSVVAHAPQVIGIALQSASTGDVDVQISGECVEGSWSWSPGFVYVGADGQLVQPAPTSGWLLAIGRAINATTIVLDIDTPFVRT